MELSSFQDKYGLTVNEAVQVMGICERKVRELIKENEIPHFRVGRARGVLPISRRPRH